MPERSECIERFLSATEWRDAQRRPLQSDASFRHYVRLDGGPRPALLMDAPPPQENARAFTKVARHLASLGLSTPDIFVADEDDGLLIIEDFGDKTYTRLLASGADEPSLYELATDVLIALHRTPRAAEIDVPVYGDSRLIDAASLLLDWYFPAVTGRDAASAVVEEFKDAWRQVLPRRSGAQETLALRDFHIDNLMVIADRAGVRRCGLLDFQDASLAPATYDFVSLIEDARRDIVPELRRAMLKRYLDAFPEQDPAAFEESMAVMAAQRHTRVIGVFTRLWRRDGKPHYLRHIPRVWRLLEATLEHPVLAPLSGWFDRHLPRDLRRVPAQ
jgi:aminoglycoside/choline kinase family phosphotransferase